MQIQKTHLYIQLPILCDKLLRFISLTKSWIYRYKRIKWGQIMVYNCLSLESYECILTFHDPASQYVE